MVLFNVCRERAWRRAVHVGAGRGEWKGGFCGGRRERCGRLWAPCTPCWGAATLALPLSSIRLTVQLPPLCAVLESSLCLRNPVLASDEITDSRVQPRLCDPRGEASLLDPGFGKPARPLCLDLVPSCLPALFTGPLLPTGKRPSAGSATTPFD